ncbi:hypothetical protein GBA52_008994 [Prunus armeniaca]|nr:hypothetical protein GBA52_008994 [Prunus armeniaca]
MKKTENINKSYKSFCKTTNNNAGTLYGKWNLHAIFTRQNFFHPTTSCRLDARDDKNPYGGGSPTLMGGDFEAKRVLGTLIPELEKSPTGMESMGIG